MNQPDSRDRPLRILHLLSYHLFTGPAEPVLALASAQRAAGHDARLACETLRDGDIPSRAAGYGVPIDKRFFLSSKSGPLQLLRDLLAMKRLWQEGGVDIIHSHRSHDHTLLALGRTHQATGRLVRTLHSDRSLGRGRGWQLRRSDALMVLTERNKEQLMQRRVLEPDRISVIEGAVDASRFCPGAGRQELRAEFGVSPDAPVALIMARMKPDRGHRVLLQAWKQVAKSIPSARLLIAGRGELEQELRGLAQDSTLKSSVIFVGYRTDLPRVYRAADLNVLLAPGNDGSCRAALEGMATALPLLAADVGALGEIVREGETGRLVPENDPGSLAAALCHMLSDRQQLEAMGQKARREALERFNLERQAREVEQVYRRILARPSLFSSCASSE